MAKKKALPAVTELVVAPKRNIKVAQDDPNADGETFAKSILNELNAGGSSIHRLAFEADPLQNNVFAGVYKQRLRLLPPYVIKRIAIQDDLVASIIQCRQNHLSAFGWPRQSRFENGFVIEPKQAALEAIENEPTEVKEAKKTELHRRIAAATKVVLNCGYTDGIPESDRLTFSQYLSQSTRNALLMGMLSTEVLWRDLPNGNKKFHAFRVIDAGTIYRAAPHSRSLENVRASALAALEKIKNERLKPERFENNEYAWVQVVDGRPVQAFTAQECLVHMFYAVPDVEMDGYPVTPLDTAISAVTTHINITTHNKLYFQYGRASHGMLVLKSEDADERVLRNMKQVFAASINSAANCVGGDSQILTKDGAVSIADFLGGQETKMTQLWTGTDWQDAMVYKVNEKKELSKLKLTNGLSIECSPAHRFWVIGDNGDPCWREQKDLKIGDYIAVNKQEVVSPKDIPTLNGKILNVDMMEVLGWMIGDGSLTERTLRLYYHHEKERDIWERHHQILCSYDIPSSHKERIIDEEEKEYLKNRYGFKTIANSRIENDINSVAFMDQLYALGFTSSCKATGGKSIPSFVYTLPTDLKASFLRGLFSADGHNQLGRNPQITIVNEKLRKEVRLLLISMGIRTCLSEGRTKIQIIGQRREYIEAKSYLKIKDKNLFFEKIGFIQKHKQPVDRSNRSLFGGKGNHIDRRTILKYIRIVKDKTKLPWGGGAKHKDLPRIFTPREQMDLNAILHGRDSCTLARLLYLMKRADVEPPKWMTDFNYEKIVEKENTGELVQMYDTTIYEHNHNCSGFNCKSDRHSLIISGIYNHQSFRMPVFSIGPEDDLKWSPIDTQGKDAEFQYLIDMNARVILSAFMVGPEEIPGWSYLSKGTASMSLSESKNEYLMEAARDVGLRPLIRCFEEFLNTSLFPLIDPVLAEMATIRLVGLEAETAEKEAIRLQQDMQVHLTMDQILEKVEKRPVGKDWGGEFFFNPAYQSILDRYFTVGQIKEYWFGHPGASKDPKYDYFRDSFFMQYQQLLMGKEQMEAEQAQAQAPDQGHAEGQAPDDALRNKVDEALGALKKSNYLPQKLNLINKAQADEALKQKVAEVLNTFNNENLPGKKK